MNRALIESRAMGQSPVEVISCAMALCAIGDLTGWVPASKALPGFGDQVSTTLWAISWILAAMLSLGVHLFRDPVARVAVEVAAITMLNIGMVTYWFSIYFLPPTGIAFKTVVLALVGCTVIITFGRATLLYRRVRTVKWVARTR